MKDSKAANLIRIRLKYDWIVLLFGLLFFLIQLIYPRNHIETFYIFLGCFISVEIFGAAAYRKVRSGGEGYYLPASTTLDQKTNAGFIWSCIFLDLFILFVASLIFFLNIE